MSSKVDERCVRARQDGKEGTHGGEGKRKMERRAGGEWKV